MTSYEQRLLQAGIELQEPLKQVKTQHKMKCVLCFNEWMATPLSKVQNHNKTGAVGCPKCTNFKKYQQTRTTNIQKLQARGLEIISEWDGTLGSGMEGNPVNVTVRNTQCGHTFTSTAKNLVTRGVDCPTCAKAYKTNSINAWSELNSAKWRQTASEWKKYRAQVTKLTRITYKQHKETINPTNLPFGRAGTEGAYHLDHIIPVRHGFDNGIDPAVIAQPSNLRVIPWLDNVVKRDKIVASIQDPT